jgi:hypothetical protein
LQSKFCSVFHFRFLLALCQSLVDPFGDNLEQCLVDLALTVTRQTAVGAGNPMEEEADIE